MAILTVTHHKGRDPEAGVTLIEMMVVLVMISIVAALIVPNVIGRPDEARATAAQTDMRTVAGALQLYRLDNGTYPTTAQGLQALAERPVSPPLPRTWPTGGYLADYGDKFESPSCDLRPENGREPIAPHQPGARGDRQTRHMREVS